MTSLLTSSPPISISHRLFLCRYSNSSDVVASSPSFSGPQRQSAPESLLSGYVQRALSGDSTTANVCHRKWERTESEAASSRWRLQLKLISNFKADFNFLMLTIVQFWMHLITRSLSEVKVCCRVILKSSFFRYKWLSKLGRGHIQLSLISGNWAPMNFEVNLQCVCWYLRSR